jgi:hypothetical protein
MERSQVPHGSAGSGALSMAIPHLIVAAILCRDGSSDCIRDCCDCSRRMRRPCVGLHTYMARRSSEKYAASARGPPNMTPTGRKWTPRLPAIKARTRRSQKPIRGANVDTVRCLASQVLYDVLAVIISRIRCGKSSSVPLQLLAQRRIRVRLTPVSDRLLHLRARDAARVRLDLVHHIAGRRRRRAARRE